jgi:hypothetical protein
MKAITEYTPDEYFKMHEKHQALKKAIEGHSRSELLQAKRTSGYAHYKFSGFYTEKLVELLGRHPDEEEIIMLVDSGYSHFGAGCTINKIHMTFSGRVNID